ncbi:MAG: type II toxin-antitoxin system VapC family toxin [Sporichthyaceae bacterium]
MKAVYLDSSALVKLARQEPESDALRRFLRRRGSWTSSELARVEVLRALAPAGDAAVSAGRGVLARCDLVRINRRVLEAAATLGPASLRSLDAIHLATAERLGSDLGSFVVYDDRLKDAARALGQRVFSPGM